METRKKNMEARLKLWLNQINDLAIKAEKAGPEAAFGLRQRIDEIKARCAMTQLKLDQLNAVHP